MHNLSIFPVLCGTREQYGWYSALLPVPCLRKTHPGGVPVRWGWLASKYHLYTGQSALHGHCVLLLIVLQNMVFV